MRYVAVIALLLCTATQTLAQRYFNNPISQYYRNDFLWNPANAGKAKDVRIYALLNKSWIGFDGAPSLIVASGDFHFGQNSGAGVQFLSDKSGVLQRDLGAIAYSYKVDLNDYSRLRFGVDLSLYRERLDNDVVSDNGQIDPTAKSFNQRPWDFDGDVGAAYENKNFTVGVTAYNLRTAIQGIGNDPSDLAIGQMLASYLFTLTSNEKISIMPLASYKIYFRHEDVFTAAAQFQYDGVFHTSVYWQSTGNIMGGIGVGLKDIGEINFFYSSNNKYGYNQQYEVGIKTLIPAGKK